MVVKVLSVILSILEPLSPTISLILVFVSKDTKRSAPSLTTNPLPYDPQTLSSPSRTSHRYSVCKFKQSPY